MRAVAKRPFVGAFTGTPGTAFCLAQLDFHRAEFGALMRAIAKGLFGTAPTGAPPVVTCFIKSDGGSGSANMWVTHSCSRKERLSGAFNYTVQASFFKGRGHLSSKKLIKILLFLPLEIIRVVSAHVPE